MFHYKDLDWTLAHLISRRAKLGEYAEIASISYLRSILPDHIRIDWRGRGYGTDIELFNRQSGARLRVEVKVARPTKDDGKFRATTYKKNHTDARKHSDVVLFWCLPERTSQAIPFIIPTDKLGGKTFICIGKDPEAYAGKWAKFRRATENIVGNI